MEISINPHPSLSMKIKASPTPFISQSGTAFFSIAVSHGPSERFSFHFDPLHGLLQHHLRAVAGKISSLTGVRDPVFFLRFVDFCIRAVSTYRDRGVEFSVSVVMRGSAAPAVQTATYIDGVLVFDSEVQRGGTGRRRGSAAPAVQAATYIDEVLVFDSEVQRGGTGRRRGSAAPAVQAPTYMDEVLVFDSEVQRGGTGRRRQPCFNPAIEMLERIKDVSSVESGKCAICLEEFRRENDLELLGKTPCSPTFHYRCVKKWLERGRTCPLCRSDVCS